MAGEGHASLLRDIMSHNRKAFTLIEMVITIVLLGIVMIPIAMVCMSYSRASVDAGSAALAKDLTSCLIEKINSRDFGFFTLMCPVGEGTWPSYEHYNYDIFEQTLSSPLEDSAGNDVFYKITTNLRHHGSLANIGGLESGILKYVSPSYINAASESQASFLSYYYAYHYHSCPPSYWTDKTQNPPVNDILQTYISIWQPDHYYYPARIVGIKIAVSSVSGVSDARRVLGMISMHLAENGYSEDRFWTQEANGGTLPLPQDTNVVVLKNTDTSNNPAYAIPYHIDVGNFATLKIMFYLDRATEALHEHEQIIYMSLLFSDGSEAGTAWKIYVDHDDGNSYMVKWQDWQDPKTPWY